MTFNSVETNHCTLKLSYQKVVHWTSRESVIITTILTATITQIALNSQHKNWKTKLLYSETLLKRLLHYHTRTIYIPTNRQTAVGTALRIDNHTTTIVYVCLVVLLLSTNLNHKLYSYQMTHRNHIANATDNERTYISGICI